MKLTKSNTARTLDLFALTAAMSDMADGIQVSERAPKVGRRFPLSKKQIKSRKASKAARIARRKNR